MTRTGRITTLVYCTVAARLEFRRPRLLCGLRPRDHVTEALINLHWLPVAGRIEFILCVLVYKSLNGIASSYIDDMIQSVSTLQRQVTLRSATTSDLFVPRARL